MKGNFLLKLKLLLNNVTPSNPKASDGHATLYLCEEKNIHKHALAKILRFEIKVRMSFF